MKLLAAAAALVLILLLQPAAGSATVPVAAVGFSFAPAALVVPAGTSIEWRAVALPHTVTTAASLEDARAGRANDAGNADGEPDTFHAPLPMGATSAHAFLEAGTFAYFCQLHYRSGMVGTIIVE